MRESHPPAVYLGSQGTAVDQERAPQEAQDRDEVQERERKTAQLRARAVEVDVGAGRLGEVLHLHQLADQGFGGSPRLAKAIRRLELHGIERRVIGLVAL